MKLNNKGVTIVELIIGVVIISIVALLFLNIFRLLVSNSVDPMINKQMNIIAQSMIEEVQSKSFSKDANGFVGPFTDANRQFFDAVSDYNGFTMNGIKNINGVNIPGLTNYNVNITVANSAIGVIPNTDSLFITVTVTNGSDNFRLSGYKLNFYN